MENSNNFFQLVAEFQKNIDWLNQILKGGESETITIDGVIKPTISKDIADKWKAIQGAITGRSAYETRSSLPSTPPDGIELAEVWNDPLSANNGLYGWSAGQWVKSPFDTQRFFDEKLLESNLFYALTALVDNNDLISWIIQGEVHNGGEWINGGNWKEGWRIPVGQTGFDTYNRYQISLVSDWVNDNVGRTIDFIVPLKTSPNLSEHVPLTLGCEINGHQQPNYGQRAYQVSDDQVVLKVSHTIAAGDSAIALYWQVRATTPQTSERWCAPTQGHYVLDSTTFGIDTLSEAILVETKPIHDKIEESDLQVRRDFKLADYYSGVARTEPEVNRRFEGQLFNGAEWVGGVSSNGWRIPIGETGVSTYNRYNITIDPDFVKGNAGKWLECFTTLKASDNLLDNLNLIAQTAVNNVNDSSIDTTIFKSGDNQLTVRYRYKLLGTESYIGSFVQVTKNNNTAVEHSLEPIESYYILEDVGAGLAAIKRIIDEQRPSEYPSLLVTSACHVAGEIRDGASWYNGRFGIAVPPGETGFNSYLQQRFDVFSFARYHGARIRFKMVVDATANLQSINLFGVNMHRVDQNGVLHQSVGENIVKVLEPDGTLVFYVEHVIKNDDYHLMPYQQMVSNSTGAVKSFHLRELHIEIISVSSPDITLQNMRDILFAEYREIPTSLGSIAGLENLSMNEGQAFDGGSLTESGFTVPQGATGNNTYKRFGVNAAYYNGFDGMMVKCRLKFDITGDVDLVNFGMGSEQYPLLQGVEFFGTNWFRDLDDGVYWFEFIYRIESGISGFGGYLQLRNSNPLPNGLEVKLSEIEIIPLVADRMPFYSRNEANRAINDNMHESNETIPDDEYYKTIVVARDGSGEFITIPEAMNSITDARKGRRYKVFVKSGVYTEVDWHVKNYVDLIGHSWKDTWIKGYLPPETPVSEIKTTETIWANWTSKLKNLRITCQNMRYPIHADSGPSSNRAHLVMEDLWVEHLANDEADDYHGVTVWGSNHAFGCGTHSGNQIYANRCRFESRTTPFYYHTHRNFAEPCHVQLDSCECIIKGKDGYGVFIQPLGSGQPDTFVCNNSMLSGGVAITDSPWLGTAQPADHCEVECRFSGNSDIPVHIGTAAWSLVLTSLTDGDNTTITATGPAVEIVFGDVIERAGANGLPPKCWGSLDIRGNWDQTGSIAYRLGDRTGEPISMVVSTESSSVTVTFDKDYGSITPADIVAEINTALSGLATAQNIDIGRLYRPVFADAETALVNDSNVGIFQGAALVKTNATMCRLMTSADDKSLFAGIALEDILPGDTGRIRKAGTVDRTWVNLAFSDAVAFGDKLAVGSIDGQLEVNNSADNFVARGMGSHGSIVALKLEGTV
ncbi:TPA: hypothetical protein NJ418_004464 [Vibrio parahaemolyticus]|nr:hypothetical protein [Vibrio parahaemolyticus]